MPRPRGRAVKINGKQTVMMYTPPVADAWKRCIWFAVKCKPRELIEDPVHCRMIFFMPRPKAHFRSNGTLKDSAPSVCSTKPDFDNLEKAVADVLVKAGLLYDDSLIVSTRTVKFYTQEGGQPGCIITLTDPITPYHEQPIL